MNKFFVTIILLLISYQFSYAKETENRDTAIKEGKSFRDKFYQRSGFSLFTDFDISPVRDLSFTKNYSVNGNTVNQDYSGKYAGFSYSFFTYVYMLRYNLYEPVEDFSISLNAPMAFGLSMFINTQSYGSSQSLPPPFQDTYSPTDGMGFLKLSIPMYLQFNYGNIATRSSVLEHGITAGIGFEYQINPIFMFPLDGELINPSFSKSSLLIPSVNIGYCFLTDAEVPVEVNLKLSLGSMQSFTSFDGRQQVSQSPMSVMLSWHRYVNF